MNLRRAVGLAVTGALVVAAPAVAQDPATSPTPTPTPTPSKASVRISTLQVVRGAVLAGDRWVVRGTVKPYVAGQRVTVRFYRAGRKVRARALAVRANGRSGRFRMTVRLSRPGRVTVRASHRATAQLGTGVARALRVQVLARRAQPGSRGLAVRRLQARLASRGYVVGRRGHYDDRTARAVMAFRKLTGMQRTFVASDEVFRRLARGQGAFRVRYPRHGRHVEADLGRQVLALIDRGKVVRIYPTSSGAPVTPTILGSYRVYMKTPGTNAKGMVHSSYFIRGYAIHGYSSVPPYPASHGCLRVPVPDAASIFAWVRPGTIVDTYYR